MIDSELTHNNNNDLFHFITAPEKISRGRVTDGAQIAHA